MMEVEFVFKGVIIENSNTIKLVIFFDNIQVFHIHI